MSHLARATLLAMVACSGPKPPEGAAPELPSDIASEPATPPDSPAPVPEPTTPAASEPASTAASGAPAIQTLYVGPQRADCQGEAPMKCLQVRESERDDWRNFFGSIAGFEHEESYGYELRVEVTRVPSPAADAPGLRYRLLGVVSKRKVAPTAKP